VKFILIAKQRLGKQASTIESLFSAWSCQGVTSKTIGGIRQLRAQLWRANQRQTVAEESPLLRFVTRKYLVKPLQRNSHFRELLPSND
jgi:hypothetical protein